MDYAFSILVLRKHAADRTELRPPQVLCGMVLAWMAQLLACLQPMAMPAQTQTGKAPSTCSVLCTTALQCSIPVLLTGSPHLYPLLPAPFLNLPLRRCVSAVAAGVLVCGGLTAMSVEQACTLRLDRTTVATVIAL